MTLLKRLREQVAPEDDDLSIDDVLSREDAGTYDDEDPLLFSSNVDADMASENPLDYGATDGLSDEEALDFNEEDALAEDGLSIQAAPDEEPLREEVGSSTEQQKKQLLQQAFDRLQNSLQYQNSIARKG